MITGRSILPSPDGPDASARSKAVCRWARRIDLVGALTRMTGQRLAGVARMIFQEHGGSMQRQGLLSMAMVGLMVLGAAGCAETDAPAADEGGASVSFVGLADGDTVATSFEACMEVNDFTIEASGEVNEGAGHHHILVDPTEAELADYADGAVDVVPKDETHIHMGDGSSCTTLELSPGEHTLVAVVADGVHAPLDPPLMSSVTVNVEE
jgi:hypothetical protein